MPIKCLWSFLFLCCYNLVFLSEAKSQQVNEVEYNFDQDTIHITGGQTFSNKINISNQTDKTIELIPFTQETMALSGLIRLPNTIILQAHEKKSFPLKYMADRQTLKSNNQAFMIGFSSNDKMLQLPQPAVFHTKLNNDRTLVLQTEQPEYYLDQSTNQIQFMVQASNIGLVPITFKLLFSGIPQGFEVTGELMPITLQPGAQIVVPFTASLRAKNRFDDFDFVMQGMDENGNPLTTNRIRILRIGSVKRFGAIGNFEREPYNNAVAFRYLSMGEHASIYQLQGNGDLDVREHQKLSYRLNIDYYQNQKAFNSYDTYVDYQAKDWGVKIGNIYENLDQTISGRGVKANYKIDKDRSVSLYAVENNYMLFSQLNNFISGAKIIAANYAIKSAKNQESYLTYLHNEHDYRGVKSDQISGRRAVNMNARHQLWVEGGYSMERSDLGGGKHAVATGVNYNYSSESYQITAMNYYSSPYYTGLRRGLIQIDTRINKMLHNASSIAARVSYLENNPKSQPTDRAYYYSNPNRIQIYELGYHTGLGKFQVDIRPYLMIQQFAYQGLGLLGPLQENWKSSAIRSVGDISFFNSEHRFSLRTDYGYTYRNTSNKPLAPFHSLRLSGNYMNRFLGFNTYIQINPYYLNDLMATTADAQYRIYSLGPNTQFTAFKGTLQAQISSMYSYYGFSRSNNLSFNGNAKWRLKGNWSLTADLYYTMIQSRTPRYFPSEPNLFETNTFDNRQIRVGIEKNFVQWNTSKGHQLQLLFFDDTNHNGAVDAGEIRPEGVVVKILQDVAITDAKGRVKFLNMASGSYMVQVENNQGWVAQEPISIVLTKNKTLEIPLVKTRVLKGKIKLMADKYLQTTPELSGIRINAVDQQGKVYTTLSNADGQYTFFLPMGRYTVSIPTTGMAFSIDNPSQDVELKEEGMKYMEDFNYKDGRRKVGIKRF